MPLWPQTNTRVRSTLGDHPQPRRVSPVSLSLEAPLDPDLAVLLGIDEPETPPAPTAPVVRRLRTPAGRASVARALATVVGRFADPYAGQAERYAVDAETGEVFELGRPYRSTRFFPRHALKRNVEGYRDFMAFAQGQDTTGWRFWNIGVPDHKAPVDELASELRRFNKAINQELSELRKSKSIEVLLIGIHLRYDHNTDAFDLHAHIICRVPEGKEDHASSRLFHKFSKIEAESTPIQSMERAVTYLLWGILDQEAMLEWPPAAVQAVWKVTTSKAKLMRAGGAFALWRRQQRDARADPAAQVERRRKAQNRGETAYVPETVPTGDRVLGRRPMTLGGEPRDAVLLERAPPAPRADPPREPAQASPSRSSPYSSATVATSQESSEPAPPPPTNTSRPRPRRPQAWWWRAWPYGCPPSSTAATSLRGLPGPLRRRLAACAPDPHRRRPAWASARRARSDPSPT